MKEPSKRCLHCALARALRAEAKALDGAGVRLRLSHAEPVWLPVAGGRLYRALRDLLREGVALGAAGPMHLAVLDVPGKTHVEVTLAVPTPRRTRVLSRAFPRYDLAALSRGFAEQVGGGV